MDYILDGLNHFSYCSKSWGLQLRSLQFEKIKLSKDFSTPNPECFEDFLWGILNILIMHASEISPMNHN